MKVFIYGHHCIITDKWYIGITKQKLIDRWEKNGTGYLKKNKDGKYSQPKFANAILKYGWDNFEHIILEEVDSFEKAKELEILYIEKYNAYTGGYNSTKGGEGVSREVSEDERRRQSRSKIEFYANNDSMKKHLSEMTTNFFKDNNNRVKQSERLKEYYKNNPEAIENLKNRASGSNNPRAKRVLCIETNEFFPTIKAAADAYGLKNPASIRNVLIGTRKTAAEKHWKLF